LKKPSIGGIVTFGCGWPSPVAITLAVLVAESVMPLVMLNRPPVRLR